jgi:hypothetical protein
MVGLVLILVESFRPWGQSGSRVRSSYALVAVADRLGFISPGLYTALARSWFVVPFGVVLALWWVLTNRLLAASAVSVIVGCGAMAMAQTVERSPLLALNGAVVGRAGGMMSVLAAVATVMTVPIVKSRKELDDRSTQSAPVFLGRPLGSHADRREADGRNSGGACAADVALGAAVGSAHGR